MRNSKVSRYQLKPISERVNNLTTLNSLLKDVRNCSICAEHLPLGPRPVLQIQGKAPILIAGQAPGKKVHESGIPFDDASGERLRQWLGIATEDFYDPQQVAILPMGFCFPGTGKSGDLPPRPECAPTWRDGLLGHLVSLQLTLVIGQYAQKYHLPDNKGSVTTIVGAWRQYWPTVVPLPHPSPRNNRWLKSNPWFAEELLPVLQERVKTVMGKRNT